ncbi:MAG: sensor histidine kinase [Phycisphaerae bacterium]
MPTADPSPGDPTGPTIALPAASTVEGASQDGSATPARTPPGASPVGGGTAVEPLEARLATLQSQLDQLRGQVRQAQQLAGLGTATAMIAHEVNNLLTPILAFSKAALKSDNPSLRERALQVTVSNVEMLVAMSGRLLELTAARSNARREVLLGGVVDDAVASLCRDLDKDGIRFTTRIDADVSVYVDRLQLQQVLFNLLLNARDVMVRSRGGRLSVSAADHGEDVEIRVHNSGPAIPPELLPHVFEPFQSSKSEGDAPARRCSGLGLALCRDLIRENDGTIDVSSTPDEGTTFVIRLPRGPNRS